MTAVRPEPRTDPEQHCDPEHGCITCGDTAVEMRVLGVDERRGLALCADAADRRETVEIALVPPVGPGDELLVHAGTAIAKLEGAGAEQPEG
jgi:hydrogenase maturation factor